MKKNIDLNLLPEQLEDTEYIKRHAAKIVRVSVSEISEIEYLRRSIDCRGKTPKYLLNVNVYTENETSKQEDYYSRFKQVSESPAVHIIGAGPSGYFAALELLAQGLKPIVFERGKDVRGRRFDIKPLMLQGIINGDSNYCYGEGGAGTFSDGKLYTRSNKRGNVRKILKILVEHGAIPDIMIDAHPHIGSDKLPKVMQNIRDTIIKFGGEVHFNSRLTDIVIKNNRVSEIIINNKDNHKVNNLILATGHSAKEVYYLLRDRGVSLEAKDFAIGFRIEHPQELINTIQYGKKYADKLPTASYKLVTQVNGKGVYSFCMCPGGIIIPASTSSSELVVNGMSMSKRHSKWANSGIVCSINNTDLVDYTKHGEFAGLEFQKDLESAFYLDTEENFLKAPAQRTLDFIGNRESSSLAKSSYVPGLKSVNLNRLFPKQVAETLRLGLIDFGRKMRGYLCEDSNVIGLESRTSSPLRIPRDRETLRHTVIENLYPVGEGSGYAGGIVSSAIDGDNAAMAIGKK